MREIKFRAWGNKKNEPARMFNMVDLIILDGDEDCSVCESHSLDSLEHVTLMQFTGLTDKNGVEEVFERDIIGEDGFIRGNIYENQVQQRPTDLIIPSITGEDWPAAIESAMARGIDYT